MNWIPISLLMFTSSIVRYLLIRKGSQQKIPTQWTNLAMFAIPLPIYIILNLLTRQSFTVTFYQLFIIVLLAFFASYLGNAFSLISIEYAPNPGYSLIISKSYVLFTTIVAVIGFHSVLTLKSVAAIILIVLFSALIMIGKTKKHKTSGPAWIVLAFGSFFCWGMVSIVSKYLFTIGVTVMNLLWYLALFVSIFILMEMRVKKMPMNALTKGQWLTMFGIGIFSVAFDFFLQTGLKIAPNIGYVNAINAASIAAVAVFSALIFKDDFSWQKMIGVFGVSAGLILLLI